DQRLAADLVECVFELGQPVGRVDVDEDEASLRGGELRHRPLGVVGRPDADAVAGLEAEGDEAGGQRVDLLLELPVGPADVLLADDERVALGKARRDAVEILADRLADERRLAPAMHVAAVQPRHGRLPRSSLSLRSANHGSAATGKGRGHPAGTLLPPVIAPRKRGSRADAPVASSWAPAFAGESVNEGWRDAKPLAWL